MASKRETISIDGTGATVELEKPSDGKVNVRVDADGAISATLHVNDKPGTTDAFEDNTYSSTSDIDDTGRDITERFVIFEVTSGTGGSGDEADVLLSSAGTHP